MRITARMQSAWARSAVDAYARRLCEHVRSVAPACCAAMTDAELGDAVQQGITRASAFGFDQEGTVRLFVEVLLALGSGFESDPLVPWATQILTDPSYRTPMDRAEALHARLVEFLVEVDGPGGLEGRLALSRLADGVRGAAGAQAKAGWADQAMQLLALAHPRKTTACGEAAVQALIGAADEAEPGDTRRALARATLMFTFGHRFDNDPFLPWMRRGRAEVTPDYAGAWILRMLAPANPPARRIMEV